MNIFSYTTEFDIEESCRNHFKSERDKIGVSCKKCNHQEYYWIKSQWNYEFKKCRSRTSFRSGTIMQSSNLFFIIWYNTMFLLTATKEGFSSKEIQRQLRLKRYEPVWAMVHKLRKVMCNREDRCTLEGINEIDEGYFTVQAFEQGQHTQKTRRGSKTKSKVMVMDQSTVIEDLETVDVEIQCRYFKATVIENHQADVTNQAFQQALDNDQTIVFTDKSTSYINIADYVELLITEKSSENTTKEILKWVRITISSAKRNFVGTYHKIKQKHLQLYLNEFLYKLNR